MKLADFKETLTNEIKSKLQKIFDEDSNEWVNQCNYLEQLNPSEFTDLKEFNERLNTCKLRVSFFSDFHSACTKMNFKTDYATTPFTQKPCLLRLFFYMILLRCLRLRLHCTGSLLIRCKSVSFPSRLHLQASALSPIQELTSMYTEIAVID